MLDLAVLARRLRVRGRAVLLHKPQPQIRTLIEVVGLHRLPGVRLELPRARVAARRPGLEAGRDPPARRGSTRPRTRALAFRRR